MNPFDILCHSAVPIFLSVWIIPILRRPFFFSCVDENCAILSSPFNKLSSPLTLTQVASIHLKWKGSIILMKGSVLIWWRFVSIESFTIYTIYQVQKLDHQLREGSKQPRRWHEWRRRILFLYNLMKICFLMFYLFLLHFHKLDLSRVRLVDSLIDLPPNRNNKMICTSNGYKLPLDLSVD